MARILSCWDFMAWASWAFRSADFWRSSLLETDCKDLNMVLISSTLDSRFLISFSLLVPNSFLRKSNIIHKNLANKGNNNSRLSSLYFDLLIPACKHGAKLKLRPEVRKKRPHYLRFLSFHAILPP